MLSTEYLSKVSYHFVLITKSLYFEDSRMALLSRWSALSGDVGRVVASSHIDMGWVSAGSSTVSELTVEDMGS